MHQSIRKNILRQKINTKRDLVGSIYLHLLKQWGFLTDKNRI